MEINIAEILIPNFFGMILLGAEVVFIIAVFKYLANRFAPNSAVTKVINVA